MACCLQPIYKRVCMIPEVEAKSSGKYMYAFVITKCRICKHEGSRIQIRLKKADRPKEIKVKFDVEQVVREKNWTS